MKKQFVVVNVTNEEINTHTIKQISPVNIQVEPKSKNFEFKQKKKKGFKLIPFFFFDQR